MDGFEAMKGRPQQLLSIRRRQSEFTLFRYRDGSFSVRRDGDTVGVWEPQDQGAAIQALANLLGLPGGGRTVRLTPPEPEERDFSLN